MYPLIVCYCGRNIGALYLLYRKLREEKIARVMNKNIDPKIAPITDLSEIQTGDILDSLGLKLDCCRGHMISSSTFYEYYK